MSDAPTIFALTWLLTQGASMLMLEVGARLTESGLLLRLGTLAHRQKLRALDSFWPLTRVRPAIERGDSITCTVILGSLIGLKSLGCAVFGILTVFWLPLASVCVPAIVAVHQPGDQALLKWVRRVATLQVTSHALAASIGFAIVMVGPVRDTPVREALTDNSLLVYGALAVSLGVAGAAGRIEALGVVKRGI